MCSAIQYYWNYGLWVEKKKSKRIFFSQQFKHATISDEFCIVIPFLGRGGRKTQNRCLQHHLSSFNTSLIYKGKKSLFRSICFIQKKSSICLWLSVSVQSPTTYVISDISILKYYCMWVLNITRVSWRKVTMHGIDSPHSNQCLCSQINRGHVEHFTARIYFNHTWKENTWV